MDKLTIADAAEFFGISKEAIHNRVRRGSLESEAIDGEKYVLVDVNNPPKTTASKKSTPKKPRAKSYSSRNTTSKVDDRYYDLLKEQNIQLQAKVEKLEGETKDLRDQKEFMLIQERLKIEQIYKDKDEQLKNILNAMSSSFILNAPDNEKHIDESQHLDAEIEFSESEVNKNEDNLSVLTPLNKYLKVRDFSKKKRKKIIANFERNADKDKRVIKLNKKIYIDLGKYAYSDYSL